MHSNLFYSFLLVFANHTIATKLNHGVKTHRSADFFNIIDYIFIVLFSKKNAISNLKKQLFNFCFSNKNIHIVL